MRILVVGGGGREHAIVHTLAGSRPRPEVLVCPGNPGTEAVARNLPVSAFDLAGVLETAVREKVDLVVVGPEQPLVDGLVDACAVAGIPVLGPTSAAARLEGSKSFAKDFMQRRGIPTAAYRTFDASASDDALRYVAEVGAPVVVKASGLAAGKGAVVCESVEEAKQTVVGMLTEDRFGGAGRTIVIEEFMAGEEASIFALCDGRDYVLLPSAQDHKQIGDGDTGPNTGGMGAYAPAPVVDPPLLEFVRKSIIAPTLAGMIDEGCPYRGFLYVGLMINGGRARVVEYNCRLGDPEAQVVLPLLDVDMARLFALAAGGRLAAGGFETGMELPTRGGAAACIVAASRGYPGEYELGKPIRGVDQVGDAAMVFHAGTMRDADGTLRTSGGRVLGVAATGDELDTALERAYAALSVLEFEGMTYRTDIGEKGLARLAELV